MMKKTLAGALLAAAAFVGADAASAQQCGRNGCSPDGTGSAGTSFSQGQGQGQGQSQGQNQGQNQGQSQTATGIGMGGIGQGGEGGTGYGGSATGGSATGGSANSGGNNMQLNSSTTYRAPLPMGNVASVGVFPAGDCGEGWALNISVPFVGVGGGRSTQNRFCLSHQAAIAAMNAGFAYKDVGVSATGLAALRQLHPEFDRAASVVTGNLVQPCSRRASNVSAILLTDPNLRCGM